jgi:NCS1 family nucleobase:cation symporter-1
VAADYSRYLPSRTSGRAITWWTFAGVGGIAFLLQFLGAGIATTATGIESNPVSGFRDLIPSWLYVLFIINAAVGAMANNAITFYGSGLTMQSLGVPLLRWRATLVDCVISTALVLYIELFNQQLQTIFSDYLAFINVWAGPFLAILLIDGLARRWHYDAAGLHKISVLSPYWGSGGFNLRGFAALVAGAAIGMVTVNAPIYVGPLAKAMGGADTAWLLPMIVGGLVYAALAVPAIRGERSQAAHSDPAVQAGPAATSQ